MKPLFTYKDQYETYLIYYYFYMYNLHTLLNTETLFSYEWLNLKDYKFYNIWRIRNYKDFDKLENSFLINSQKHPQKLGEDIINRGGFWPFTVRFREKKDEREIIFGKHRIYALKSMQNEEVLNKEFLFIDIPNKEYRKYIYPKTTVDLYWFFDGPLYKFSTNKHELMEFAYSSNADTLSETFFKMDKNNTPIIPNPILNNKQLFEEFINAPFDHNNIAYKLLIDRITEIGEINRLKI